MKYKEVIGFYGDERDGEYWRNVTGCFVSLNGETTISFKNKREEKYDSRGRVINEYKRPK